MLGAQVAAQCVDATVRSGTVRTRRTVRGVGVVVVPPIGHFFATRLASPVDRVVRRHLEHFVVKKRETVAAGML